MRFCDISFKPTTRVLRQFAVAWLVFFNLLAVQQFFRYHHSCAALALSAIGCCAGLFCLAYPRGVRWLYVAAMVVAFPVGWLVSRVALAMMFYLVFTPVAFIFRIAGRDALARRRKPGSVSYWSPKPAVTDLQRYFHLF
jgi:hypothetical protein